jgi:hypothetical protein
VAPIHLRKCATAESRNLKWKGVASPITDLHRGGDYTSAHMQCQFRDSHQNDFVEIAQLLITSTLIHRCQNGAPGAALARFAL